MSRQSPDPKLDLVFERHVDVSPDLVWKAWTMPEHIKNWFTPAPWKTVECEIDLRPGGMFRFVMESPEGERHPHLGCYLEVVEKKRLVWTRALAPGFRPVAGTPDVPYFTAVISIEPGARGGTKYTAVAMHATEADAKKHGAMGFEEGWGAALDQLVALAKKLPG